MLLFLFLGWILLIEISKECFFLTIILWVDIASHNYVNFGRDLKNEMVQGIFKLLVLLSKYLLKYFLLSMGRVPPLSLKACFTSLVDWCGWSYLVVWGLTYQALGRKLRQHVKQNSEEAAFDSRKLKLYWNSHCLLGGIIFDGRARLLESVNQTNLRSLLLAGFAEWSLWSLVAACLLIVKLINLN